MRPNANTPEKFWARVDTSSPDGCWPWIGATKEGGYGKLGYQGKGWLAHRLSYVLTFGDLEPSVEVCHRCDNPPCCRPDHLFEGSQAANIQDMIAKGRAGFKKNRASGLRNGAYTMPERRRVGSLNGAAKLTETQVREIRVLLASSNLTNVAIGSHYGVSHQAIRRIRLGTHWQGIT